MLLSLFCYPGHLLRHCIFQRRILKPSVGARVEMTSIGIKRSLDGSALQQTAAANVNMTRDTGMSLVSRRKHLAILSEVTNKLHHKQEWIKKRSGHYVSSIHMLKVFGGKDQISNYNLLMHSPVVSGILIRKKDWVKDLCTFSSIYFIGKWTLTISKARDYSLFSLCILFFFLKSICFLKKNQSLLGTK